MEGRGGEYMSLSMLPEGCIANVLSFTSPKEACRLSTVSCMFKSAAESDAVWDRFLPDDYLFIISKSNNPLLLESVSTKKQLYLSLCDNPILIDDGKKSFSLERESGKKCYMISARDLGISWGDAPEYWGWHPDPASRFAEVVELLFLRWLEIRGTINTNVLTPATWYTAHVVFKLTAESYGLFQPARVTIGFVGGESSTRNVFLRQHLQRSRTYFRLDLLDMNVGASVPPNRESDRHFPKERGDGWMEFELGEFFNEGDSGELEIKVLDTNWKSGLIVEGIEIRPKEKALQESHPCFIFIQ